MVDCRRQSAQEPGNDSVTLMDVELCGCAPISIRDLVDELGGAQVSGYQRAELHCEVQRALAAFYEAAREVEPTDERAAILLLRMVARDAAFEAEPWMRELFAAHREALDETFHQPDAHRTTDYGSARADGEDEDKDDTSSRARSAAEKRHAVASLFVSGRVDEAARLAGVSPFDLQRWKQMNPYFRAACRNARDAHNAQEQRMAAE